MDRFPHDPAPVADESDAASHRNTSRDSLLLTATLKVGGREAKAEAAVRIRNLSAGGLMAEYGKAVPLDTPVAVEVRGIGWVDGKVAWATDGRLGIAFDTPIDPLLARKPVGTGKRTPVYLKPPLPL